MGAVVSQTNDHEIIEVQNLKAAFQQGDHVAAKRLLSRLQLHQPGNITTEFKLKLNGEPSTDVTLLHLAACHGWLDIIKTVGFTTTYNCKDNNGRTPLVYAAVGGNISVIDYLITEQGCDPTIPYSDGALPLHIACHMSESVELLSNVTKSGSEAKL